MKNILLRVVVCVMFILFSGFLDSAIPASERASLIALYNSTNGDSWTNNSNWKTPPLDADGFAMPGTENTWFGIMVTNLGTDHVTDISMGSNNLAGTLPTELGILSNLNYLYLYSNHLTGSIPTELGNLSNLTNIYLNSNQLTGSIPTELGNLTNLKELDLGRNQLSGSIPTSLANLTNLISNETDIGYNGLYTNNEPLLTFLNSKDPDWEDTQTIAPANVSATDISISSIAISWTPITYTGDTGGYKVYYSTTSGGPYTYSGMTTDKSTASYDVTGLSSNTTYYLVAKTQTDPNSRNENTVVSEYSEETCATTQSLPETDPPFGSFDTPIDGSTVASSIPVTGWALDETGIDIVKIYREQGNSLIYIGDAIFVEGARPDVAQLYPEYPNNTRAGWGTMMLTNFLPNSGNGTFVVHAIATDLVGKTTTLGTKTIHCDNVNAVKPFGAIDTPTQGGTAAGSNFRNHGWVLTPLPNAIPADGSTINVYIDGVYLGHPTYNIYRSDIALLFPGYANIDGAHAYFDFDTTTNPNGVHTIYWTASDDVGNTDGIGSRYFSIQNSGASSVASVQWSGVSEKHTLSKAPLDDSSPVEVIKGFNGNVTPLKSYPDDNGFVTVDIQELERAEVRLFPEGAASPDPIYTGYQITGNQLTSLPIGSTMDTERGIFYWLPGAGFIGQYRFVFMKKGAVGHFKKKLVNVVIHPRF